MNVPFVDLPKQIEIFKKDLEPVIREVMFQRADFIMRQDLLDFEKAFAGYIGAAHAVGVANGSDALNLCLSALGIVPGDEVITVAHTFVATIAAIHHCGAIPVLVDVADDYNIDVRLIEPAVTKKTKAIMVVHLNGRTCDMDPILEIASRRKLAVIEDSAQGIGALYKGKKAGSFGVMSTNSFYPFKILGCFGDGGMIVTNDKTLDYTLRCLRDNGQDRTKGDILYYGWNSRLDNLQAAILNTMMPYLPDMIKRRRAVARRYQEGLRGIGDIRLPPYNSDDTFVDSFQNYVIRTSRRDALQKYLREHDIGTLISWPVPNHRHRNLQLDHFFLPNTEAISREVLSLPMHPALTDGEVAYVIDITRQFYR
ncbi:MAG: DegT/DnrJ/EryC1/StrS family aminotransferase [Spirochaetales bacterium]|nr:DegT/DnrJ/EryC1/StrS family aminotransferase [Spirochaetales bacterium]